MNLILSLSSFCLVPLNHDNREVLLLWKLIVLFPEASSSSLKWDRLDIWILLHMWTSPPSLLVPQVIYRTLPKWESLDPFGLEGQQQLRVTNIRVRLLKRQPCPCQAKDAAAAAHEAVPTRHFAIYDLIVKGSCFCNGHAEQCVPAPGYQPIRDRSNHVVREEQGFDLRCISVKSVMTNTRFHKQLFMTLIIQCDDS